MGALSRLAGRALGHAMKSSVQRAGLNGMDKCDVISEAVFDTIIERYGDVFMFYGPYWVNKMFVQKKYSIGRIEAKVRDINVFESAFNSLDAVTEYIRTVGLGTVNKFKGNSDGALTAGFTVTDNDYEFVFKVSILESLTGVEKFCIGDALVVGYSFTRSAANLFAHAILCKDNYWYALLFYEMTEVCGYNIDKEKFMYYISKEGLKLDSSMDISSILLGGDLKLKVGVVDNHDIDEIIECFRNFADDIIDLFYSNFN